jgi:UDP-glucose 4-epimerase
MKTLVTGSAGHLGEALVRALTGGGHEVVGLDLKASPFTRFVGSIADRGFVRASLVGIGAIVHTATLHKPHVGTHACQDFVDTNVTGTLNLLQEAVAAGVQAFVFTSTTSVFGHASTPGTGQPAAWITESTPPVPKNIYGVTKLAAEHLCELFHAEHGLPALVLRTSRFFLEIDDDRETRETYADTNTKVNEFLYRRADLADVVSAHLLALEKAGTIGFGRFLISATTPFTVADLPALGRSAPDVVKRHVPRYEDVYRALGWSMLPQIDRVYVNDLGRKALGWEPRYDFARVLDLVASGKDHRSPLARVIGSKGYHDRVFEDGPYPVRPT